QRRSLVDVDVLDEEVVGDQIVIGLGVGGGRLDQLADVLRRAPGGEAEQRQRVLDRQAANLVGDQAQLALCGAHEAGARVHDRARRRLLLRGALPGGGLPGGGLGLALGLLGRRLRSGLGRGWLLGGGLRGRLRRLRLRGRLLRGGLLGRRLLRAAARARARGGLLGRRLLGGGRLLLGLLLRGLFRGPLFCPLPRGAR